MFKIEGKKFFTFGGASSQDIQGGVLDPHDPDYARKRIAANKSRLPYRIKGISWWEQELPTEEEMQEGIRNLEKVNYKVDYVITHCLASSVQRKLERYFGSGDFIHSYKEDILTEYFDRLEEKLQYKYWYCGHYHLDMEVDEKHGVVYEGIGAMKP